MCVSHTDEEEEEEVISSRASERKTAEIYFGFSFFSSVCRFVVVVPSPAVDRIRRRIP